jgi:PAS domain S-box-containing protein
MLEFFARLFRKPSRKGDEAECKHADVEERFRLLVESVQDYAIFMLDPQGHITTWNLGAQRIKGYAADEIIGQHFSRFYTPEDIESGKPQRELDTALATGKYEEEAWRLRKDGSRFWANIVITALRDQDGNLRGFGKVTRDLTARREAEEHTRRLLQEEAARHAAEASALEARRAQREERRQREQLRVTLASIGDAVIVTDKEGRVTFLNPVAETLTGRKSDEAAGQRLEHVFRIINEQTRRAVEDPVNKVLRKGIIVGLANHSVLIAKDGREMPIDDSAAPIRDEEGTIAGVVLVFRDVTETRRAIEARLRLAAIVESSEDAIISKNLDGIVTSWNRGAEHLYGYSAEEMIGKPLTTLVPADHPDELPENMDQLKRGERIAHYETVRVRKDGSRVDVAVTVSPIRDAEGKIIGASTIARDISAVKRQEAHRRFLAGASTLLAELLDVPSTLQRVAGLSVPAFADWCTVDMLDQEGGLRRVAVAHVNPAKVQLAHEIHRRFPPDPEAPGGVWHVLRTGRSQLVSEILDSMLAENIRDSEQLRSLRELGLKSYMGVPLTVRGKTIGVITFLMAESGRRYNADDLQLAEDLTQRAAIAIENAQLYDELKEADRRKNEWIAMLAHELRNPLAPIRNALHIMKTPGVGEVAIEQARQMSERQVLNMVRLVDDLLDVSRIMRGRIELRKEPIDLATVITRAAETAQPMLDTQGQELVISITPEPLRLEADPMRLTQIVANLLHNAAKFSERAGRIWLSVERQGSEAVIKVRDEGSGISPDLLPRVFDLFVQADGSLERSRGGLGIGLTLVRRLVEMHGGAITARSEGPGRGSEFTVRLPGLKEVGVEEPTGGGTLRAVPAASRRVLVVDDNVDAAESVGMLLRIWGHTVRLAHNGPETLCAAKEYQPEVILLDIGLPGMNGYDVARRLREQPSARNVLLIALTGYGQDDDRRRTEEAGFDHHLTKPVEPLALQKIIATEVASGV